MRCSHLSAQLQLLLLVPKKLFPFLLRMNFVKVLIPIIGVVLISRFNMDMDEMP